MDFKKFVELDEEAVLNTEGLGLYFDPSINLLGLYKHSKEFVSGIENNNSDELEDYWLGTLIYGEDTKESCLQVDKIFTKKNYGPLMYLLTMEITKSDTLKSSLSIKKPLRGLRPYQLKNYVSDEAKNVWKNFYDGRGKDLVESAKLSKSYHEEDYLNRKYINVKNYNVSKLLKIGKSLIDNDVYKEKKTTASEFFEAMVSNKMNQIYDS